MKPIKAVIELGPDINYKQDLVPTLEQLKENGIIESFEVMDEDGFEEFLITGV